MNIMHDDEMSFYWHHYLFPEPFAVKKLLVDHIDDMDVSVLTTDRSTLIKSLMR
jgi:hypothetical protein